MKKLNTRSLQIDQQLLDRLIKKIRDELGLSFSNKTLDVVKYLLSYFNEHRIEVLHSRIERLLKEDLSQNFDLIEKLTIPETYFFRNQKLFSVLKKEIFPELIQKKIQKKESLTIWSAGCSSGEEAYSVAMILDQILKNNPASIPVRILATDLNKHILKKAKQGIYSSWSFRNMPVKFLEEYFTPKDARHFQISHQIRKMVQFEQHNLKQGPFPVNNDWQQFDLIICRNVLIYFDKQTMLEVLHKFHDLLQEDGYFISGPAEVPSLHFKKFKAQLIQNVIFYRKHVPGKVSIKTSVKKSQAKKSRLKIVRPRVIKPKKLEQTIPESLSVNFIGNNDKPVDELSVIKNLADNGNLEDAHKLLESYLSRNNLDSKAYYLLGNLLLEMGKIAEAEKNFQRALFLQPDQIMAHFHLANLYTLNGQWKERQRYLDNVLDLLRNFKPEQEIPDSEGLSAFQFKQMVEKILETSQLAS